MANAPERSCLLAGVAFVDGVDGSWGCWELSGWFQDYVVAPGRMAHAPSVVVEQGFGIIGIDPRWSGVTRKTEGAGSIQQLPRLLDAARRRVTDTLRAFLPPRGDDRFLHGALYAKRVERRHDDSGKLGWEPTPSETDRLSDIVLSMFAADMLMHREFHEHNLCVCEVCGRVSFDPGLTSQSGCRVHNVRGHSGGFPRFQG